MTERSLTDAIAHVLAEEVFIALESAGIGLPEILNIAALIAFRDKWPVTPHVDNIRRALRMLENPGYFVFDKEENDR